MPVPWLRMRGQGECQVLPGRVAGQTQECRQPYSENAPVVTDDDSATIAVNAHVLCRLHRVFVENLLRAAEAQRCEECQGCARGWRSARWRTGRRACQGWRRALTNLEQHDLPWTRIPVVNRDRVRRGLLPRHLTHSSHVRRELVSASTLAHGARHHEFTFAHYTGLSVLRRIVALAWTKAGIERSQGLALNNRRHVQGRGRG